jgi:hypothetical protein
MAISFPFEFVDLATPNPPPFVIEANPNYPDEEKPVCILENQGTPPGPDNFITVGPLGFPNAADPWQLTFRWATKGPSIAGSWQLDAFLEGVSATGAVFPGIAVPNIIVPGFTKIVPGGSPQNYDVPVPIAPAAVVFTAPGVYLLRLYATLRWNLLPATPKVRVVGRAQGPLIEYYRPV